MDEKTISPLLNQTCLSKIGAYISERMSIDLYYLVEVIYHLIPVYGEDKLEKDFPNYEKVKKKLKKLNKLLGKSKTFYDVMSDKNFKTKFSNMDIFQQYLDRQFKEVGAKIPAIQLDVYKLFHFLINNCSIKHQLLKGDMLKILEYRDNTKINPDLNKQKK